MLFIWKVEDLKKSVQTSLWRISWIGECATYSGIKWFTMTFKIWTVVTASKEPHPSHAKGSKILNLQLKMVNIWKDGYREIAPWAFLSYLSTGSKRPEDVTNLVCKINGEIIDEKVLWCWKSIPMNKTSCWPDQELKYRVTRLLHHNCAFVYCPSAYKDPQGDFNSPFMWRLYNGDKRVFQVLSEDKVRVTWMRLFRKNANKFRETYSPQ